VRPARADAAPAALEPPEFDAIAKWYDFDYDRSMRRDLAFYRRCAEEGGDPVLELGVGTGRVAVHLAKQGFSVTGIELSSAMLDKATERLERAKDAAKRVRLLRGDMADFRIKRRFRTILVPFRAFHHLYTVDRQLAALRSIRNHLAPGGIVVVDLFNPDVREFRKESGKTLLSYERKHPRTGNRIVQRFRMTCDFPRQMGFLEYTWDEYRGNRKVGSDHAPMRWRWLHRYEFEHLLARTGLRPFRLLGGFDGAPFGADSEEMIFFAQRA
jgi:SAM-dependent methyltransferase